jgi:hypothetical protein
MTILERLKELQANVSPGSWSENGIRELLRFGNKHDGPWNEGRNYIPDEKDADLIAVACGNLPALLEVVKAAQIARDTGWKYRVENARVEDALAKLEADDET